MKDKRFSRNVLRMATLIMAIVIGIIVINLVLLGGAFLFLTLEETVSVHSDYMTEGQSYKVNKEGNRIPRVASYAAALEEVDGIYTMKAEMLKDMEKRGYWAMLLNGDGTVIWEYDRPRDIAKHFSAADIASFSRWYLSDYPVRVWGIQEKLFVLALPKGSLWKYVIVTPMQQMHFYIWWVPLVILCNFFVIFVLCLRVTHKWQRTRDRARNEWIASVSHDIRTPLSMVLGYAGALEQDTCLSETAYKQVVLIRSQGEEMRRRIKDLKVVNRLEYAMEPMQLEPLSLAELVRQTVVDSMNIDTEGRYPIEIDITPEASAYQIRGDRELLTRMLQNIVRNSMLHNPNGCQVSIQLSLSKRNINLVISDNGCGFTAKQLTAWNVRNEEKIQDSSNGHGMGMKIIAKIVRAHKGKMYVSNLECGGSCCKIIL